MKKLKNIISLANFARERHEASAKSGAIKRLEKSARRTLRIKGGVQTNQDFLLAGDHEAYGKNEYEQIAPWMFYEVPADTRVGGVIDGRLPNGNSPGLIGLRHMNEDDVSTLAANATRNGISVGLKTGLAVSALTLLASASSFSISIPDWTLQEWVFDLPVATQMSAISAEMAVWSIEMATNLVSTAINGASTLAVAAGLGVASAALAMSVATTSSLNDLWVRYRRALTAHLTLPTREALHLWKNELANRAEVMDAYNSAALQSITRLKDLPFLRLGKATGLMSDRGLRLAPLENSVMGWDGESVRQHIICFGETGTGKTRRFLKPLFQSIMSADWGDHTHGAIIFDGKAELAFTLRDSLPAHRRDDFILIGTDDGAFGVDLLASMTPVEVADQFLLIATQIQGADGNSGKWLSGAANAVKHGAFLAQYLETLPPKDLTAIWKGRPYKPYSLLGLLAMTTEANLYENVSKAILDKFDEGERNIPSDVIAAARFYVETWTGYAPETRSSYQSNITDTLGQLSGTGKLEQKFASGRIDGSAFIDIDEAFRGKIIGIGLSGTEDSTPGLIIANWLKSRLYVLGQRRISKAAKADEMLKRVVECQHRYRDLNKREVELSILKDNLGLGLADALDAFKIYFPSAETSDANEMMKVVSAEIRAIRIKLRPFTREVRDIAFSRDSKKLKELERIRDLPTTSSVACFIDEYQAYATASEGGKSDSSFLNVARASGVYVVAATQSLQGIYQAVGHTAALNILNCMVSKITFSSKDPDTQDYFIKLAGTGYQGMTTSPNAYSSFGRLVRDWGYWKRQVPGLHKKSAKPDFRNMVPDDVLTLQFDEIDVGAKANVDVDSAHDPSGGMRHSRYVEKETAIKQEVSAGGLAPYLSVTDLNTLDQGRAFCFLSRAGRVRADFINLDSFNDKAT